MRAWAARANATSGRPRHCRTSGSAIGSAIQLSGGQQQRVAIARALVNNPRLLLADEPTGNLDTATSQEVMDVFARLREEHGLTLVIITHERDIAAWGTRTIDFKDGQVVLDRTHEQAVPV